MCFGPRTGSLRWRRCKPMAQAARTAPCEVARAHEGGRRARSQTQAARLSAVGRAFAPHVCARHPANENHKNLLRLVLHRRVFKIRRTPGKGGNEAADRPLPSRAWGREGVPERMTGIHDQACVEDRVEIAPPARRFISAQPGGRPRDRRRGKPPDRAAQERGRRSQEEQRRQRQQQQRKERP